MSQLRPSITEADRVADETIRYWRQHGIVAKEAYFELTGEVREKICWESVRRIMADWEDARRRCLVAVERPRGAIV